MSRTNPRKQGEDTRPFDWRATTYASVRATEKIDVKGEIFIVLEKGAAPQRGRLRFLIEDVNNDRSQREITRYHGEHVEVWRRG